MVCISEIFIMYNHFNREDDIEFMDKSIDR